MLIKQIHPKLVLDVDRCLICKKNNQILLRIVSYANIASDSLHHHESVRNSNFEPILYAFEIETHNP